MKVSFNISAKAIAAVGAMAATGIFAWFGAKNAKIQKENAAKIEAVVGDLSKKTHVEISNDILEAAAEHAAAKACEQAMDKVMSEYRIEIKESVRKAYSECSEDILEQIKAEASDKLNLEHMLESVERRASDKVYRDLVKKMEDYNMSLINQIKRNASASNGASVNLKIG